MFHSLRSRNMILLYHRVAAVERDPWTLCVTPEHFAEHLEVLQRCRRVGLNELKGAGRWLGGEASVAITFDDGYSDNYHAASQILKRYDTPATFFIATGYIGETREFWWDELERIAGDSYFSLYQQLQPMCHGLRRALLDGLLETAGQLPPGRTANLPMTQEELHALASDTLFEIGAHTVTHPLLSAQPPDVQQEEIRASKDWLEGHLDRAIESFSYPYGGTQHYDDASVHAVRQAGFVRACTTASRPMSGKDSPYELPRINVTDMDGDEFYKLLFT